MVLSKEMAEHNIVGYNGEERAAEYWIAKGYSILERNWHFKHKELDIVATKDGMLVIVEVKTRSNDRYGSPLNAINARKIRNTVDAANAYVRYRKLDMPIRFDIVTLVEDDGTLEHIEDAFHSPLWHR